MFHIFKFFKIKSKKFKQFCKNFKTLFFKQKPNLVHQNALNKKNFDKKKNKSQIK